MEYKYCKKSIVVFFSVVVFLTAICEYLICNEGPGWLYLVLMWIPAISALIANIINFKVTSTAFSFKGLFNNSNFHFCKIRYIILGIILPLIYLLIPYLIYWETNPVNFAYTGVPFLTIMSDIWLIAIVGIFVNLISATGEEIGWRGFEVPALLERLGLNKTLLISSLFWCCWHLPILIWGDYMSGTSLLYQVPAFILCIFPVGVIAGVLVVRSGSVWPAAFLHAAHNNFDQGIFQLITRGDDMMYYVSETGIYTIVCAWLIAIALYFIEKKKINN